MYTSATLFLLLDIFTCSVSPFEYDYSDNRNIYKKKVKEKITGIKIWKGGSNDYDARMSRICDIWTREKPIRNVVVNIKQYEENFIFRC